jgi:hypothetical protein
MNYNYPNFSTSLNNWSFVSTLIQDLAKSLGLEVGSIDVHQLVYTLRSIVIASIDPDCYNTINNTYDINRHLSNTINNTYDTNRHLLSDAVVHSFRDQPWARQEMTSLLVEHLINKSFEEVVAQGVAQVVQAYTAQIKSLEVVLSEVLKLYGATALVSDDPEVRRQAEELLKSNKIDIESLIKKF